MPPSRQQQNQRLKAALRPSRKRIPKARHEHPAQGQIGRMYISRDGAEWHFLGYARLKITSKIEVNDAFSDIPNDTLVSWRDTGEHVFTGKLQSIGFEKM